MLGSQSEPQQVQLIIQREGLETADLEGAAWHTYCASQGLRAPLAAPRHKAGCLKKVCEFAVHLLTYFFNIWSFAVFFFFQIQDSVAMLCASRQKHVVLVQYWIKHANSTLLWSREAGAHLKRVSCLKKYQTKCNIVDHFDLNTTWCIGNTHNTEELKTQSLKIKIHIVV